MQSVKMPRSTAILQTSYYSNFANQVASFMVIIVSFMIGGVALGKPAQIGPVLNQVTTLEIHCDLCKACQNYRYSTKEQEQLVTYTLPSCNFNVIYRVWLMLLYGVLRMPRRDL